MEKIKKIKDTLARELGYEDWENLKRLKTAQAYFQFWVSYSDEIAERYGQMLLEEAAENFEKEYKQDFQWKPEMEKYKQSILSTQK